MSLYETAFAVIHKKRMDLEMALADKEQAIRREWAAKGGGGGALFVDVIADYEDRMKQLADACLNKRRWVIEQSVLPGWFQAKKWQTDVNFEMNLLYLACFNRLDTLSKEAAITSDSFVRETTGRWDRAYHKVGADLELAMMTTEEEALSRTKKLGVILLQRSPWVGGGVALTYLANLLHKLLGS